ncbi:hypothetical protein F2P81_009670 [Scophthalmus maximus]|uniref:Uncharacterized protein n=1 Tax=Scophthalmus maximus TaxID=52904 RepID=A0A6A4SVC1_SCOMX|nr:hypothetical protein F2P81_009670 [Scophthalmus maximus]
MELWTHCFTRAQQIELNPATSTDIQLKCTLLPYIQDLPRNVGTLQADVKYQLSFSCSRKRSFGRRHLTFCLADLPLHRQSHLSHKTQCSEVMLEFNRYCPALSVPTIEFKR